MNKSQRDIKEIDPQVELDQAIKCHQMLIETLKYLILAVEWMK